MDVHTSTPENAAWKDVCETLGLKYRQRSVTGALVALCVFHSERTPSMWMRPNGKLECYGCGNEDRVQGFIERFQDEQSLIEEYEILYAREDPWSSSYDPTY